MCSCLFVADSECERERECALRLDPDREPTRDPGREPALDPDLPLVCDNGRERVPMGDGGAEVFRAMVSPVSRAMCGSGIWMSSFIFAIMLVFVITNVKW